MELQFHCLWRAKENKRIGKRGDREDANRDNKMRTKEALLFSTTHTKLWWFFLRFLTVSSVTLLDLKQSGSVWVQCTEPVFLIWERGNVGWIEVQFRRGLRIFILGPKILYIVGFGSLLKIFIWVQEGPKFNRCPQKHIRRSPLCSCYCCISLSYVFITSGLFSVIHTTRLHMTTRMIMTTVMIKGPDRIGKRVDFPSSNLWISFLVSFRPICSDHNTEELIV